MRPLFSLSLLLCLMTFSACNEPSAQKETPRTPSFEASLYKLVDIKAAKVRADKGQEPFASLVQALESEAKELMDLSPPSVMQKKLMPPSGNMHDYYSLGVYWWPNPETEDGLPYIRKDGKKNPEYDNYDGVSLHKMARAVFTLALAYAYTEQEPYAQKAHELIHTWFVDSATHMNPHLEYGQAIPGIVEGRGIGIIETGTLLKVVNAVGFLQESPSFPLSTREALTDWISAYNHWMVTSEKGWDERRWHNNHGSSYDSQVATFAMFTGEDSLAQLILDSVIIKRINRQIEPNGSQPWELERTKSMTYSIKNLDHLMENAILAQQYEFDLWGYESPDGRSLKQAVKFLIPYMLGQEEWPYEQYGGIESKKTAFQEMLWVAHQYLDDPLIDEAFKTLCMQTDKPLKINLLYPVIK